MHFELPGSRMRPSPRERNYRLENERRAERCRQERADAILALGGKCVCCGSTEDLQFDHIDVMEKEYNWHEMRSMARWARWKYYKRKIRDGQIQLLCKLCNGAKQDRRDCPCNGEGWR